MITLPVSAVYNRRTRVLILARHDGEVYFPGPTLTLRAAAILQMVVKVFLKQFQSTQDRRTGHVDERAIALASVEVDDLLKLVTKGCVAMTRSDFGHHRRQDARFHSTSRALTA